MAGQILYNNRDMKPLVDMAKLDEGTLTPVTGSTTQGKTTIGQFANELELDDLVVSDGITAEGVIQVKKRTNETNPIGKMVTNPKGEVPTDKVYTWGAYKPREADIEFNGDALIMLPVKATDAIIAGAYIAAATDGSNNYVVSASATAKIVLAPVAAGKTLTVPVLDGYRV